MKKKLITLLLINTVFNIHSQQNNTYIPNKIIAPSPTAASLGAYGDIPTSNFTGTPNISVPIYEIKTNDYSLPIDLSYNASSIRVAQDASWVGLGWSLNAGGVITRTIRGLDDLDPYMGYYYAPALPPNDLENDYSGLRGAFLDVFGPNGLCCNEKYRRYVQEHWEMFFPADHNYFMDISLGQLDAEPDIYYYNFGGHTGSFVMGKKADGSPIIMLEQNDLKFEFISIVDLNIGRWKVTAPDGTLYYFNTTELNQGYVRHSDLPENELKGLSKFEDIYTPYSVSSWYLDTIQTLKGDEIKFNYTASIPSLSLVSRQELRYDRISINDNNPWLFNYIDLSRQINYERYLNSIEFENGKIEFITKGRSDIEARDTTDQPQRLEYIQIYDKKNNLIKEFGLTHSYFNNSYAGNTNPYAYLRLKLDAVTEYSKLGYPNAKSLPYTFIYNDPNNLPSKYSRKVDAWGFYNFGIRDVRLDNQVYPTMLPQVTVWNRTFPGVERIPDETGTYSQKGILNTMTYPTGGKTNFSYEPNKNYFYTEKTEITNNYLGWLCTMDNDQYEDILTTDFSLKAQTKVKVEFTTYPLLDELPPADAQEVGSLKKLQPNGTWGLYETFYYYNYPKTMSLPVGNYRMEIADFDVSYANFFSISDGTTTPITTKNYIETGPGNRIKTIKNYDSNGIETGTKKFIYTKDGYENGLSSGKLYGSTKEDEVRGVYFHETGNADVGDIIHNGVWATETEMYLVRKSDPIFSYGLSSQSGFIGYDTVYVLEGNNGTGGITKYSYVNSAPPFNDFTYPHFISGLPLYRDPIVGKLKSVEYLNSNRELLESHEYVYTEKAATSIKGLKIFVDRPSPFPGYHFDDDGIKFYDNISKWYALTSKIITKKLNGINLTITEEYSYDSPNNKNVTKTQTTNSKGEQIVTTSQYPTDHPAGTGIPNTVYDAMIAKNIIDPVIKQEKKVNNNLVSTQVTTYKNWKLDINHDNIPDNVFLPEFVKAAKGANPLEDRVQYISYYPNGNVQEVSKTDGTHIVYIWGYKNEYPIAMIENATYANVTSQVDNLQALSDTGTETSLILALSTLHNSFPNALVTTYTYKPLIGVSTITDPKGYTTYYNYDNFGRLQNVKDKDGNILSENEYHYKN